MRQLSVGSGNCQTHITRTEDIVQVITYTAIELSSGSGTKCRFQLKTLKTCATAIRSDNPNLTSIPARPCLVSDIKRVEQEMHWHGLSHSPHEPAQPLPMRNVT